MKENTTTKSTKKKNLLYWLIIAACLLIIAAITVGVIFAVKGNGQTPTLDNQQQPDDGNGDNNPPDEDDGNGGEVDTSSQYEFIVPVREVNLSKAHVFTWNETLKYYRLHQGMDFAAKAGSEVLAAVDGTVREIAKDEYDCTYIILDHADGVTTVYSFVEPVESLKKGAQVNRGDVIATVATATGVENADGDHLHFEVYKNGVVTDPDDYLNLTSK